MFDPLQFPQLETSRKVNAFPSSALTVQKVMHHANPASIHFLVQEYYQIFVWIINFPPFEIYSLYLAQKEKPFLFSFQQFDIAFAHTVNCLLSWDYKNNVTVILLIFLVVKVIYLVHA